MIFRKIFIQHGLLFRLIATIMLIIFIPLLIISLLVVEQARTELDSSINENCQNNLGRFSLFFNESAEAMRNNAIKMSLNSNLRSSTINNHPYNAVIALEQLKYYKMNLLMAEECAIYFHHDSKIYTSSGKYDLSFYLKQYLEDAEQQHLTELIETRKPGYLSAFNRTGNEGNALFYLFPISTMNPDVYDATAIFLITRESFISANRNIYDTTKQSVLICDISGEALFGSSPEHLQMLDDLEMTAFLKDDSRQVISLANESQSLEVFKAKESRSNRVFLLFVPQEIYRQKLDLFAGKLRLLTNVGIAFCTILALYAFYLNYKPLLKLVKEVNSADAGKGPIQNEIDSIRSALEQKDQKNNMLCIQFAEQRYLLIQQLFRRLLDGETVKKGQFDQLSIKLDGPNYCAMAICLMQAEKTEKEDFLSSMRNDSGDCHVLELDRENQIVLLCNLQTQEQEECLQIANRIRQKATASKIDLKIGIGRRTDDFSGIHLSYQGALCALESYDHGKIVLFDHVVSHFSVLEKYPSEDVLNFIQYVKLGRKDDALHILDRIARLTEMNYASRLIQQYVCYDIVSLFLKSVDKSVMLLSPDETSRLLNFHNANSLFEQLKEKVAAVCDAIASNKQNENRKLTQSIIDYVDQHFIEEDICLTNVADQFNISMYTLSRLFKEAAGIGFKEYVTGKRMEMSKNLLLSTPKSVKEISAAVGYNDVSYYIKLFKNLEGVTPIGFREMISVQIADQ